MKRLVIMRGISGSGKSTLAKEIANEDPANLGVVCSTDDYFVEDGVYTFNGAEIAVAHEWNQTRVQRHMRHDTPIIVVDNTNTMEWEFAPYLVMAEDYGYEVEVREPATAWAKDAQSCADKTVHGVPLEVIEAQLERFEVLRY